MQRRKWMILASLLLPALAACDSGGGKSDEPTCTDGVTNGAETDVDCGGDCDACLDGSACGVDADCASGHCEASVCTEPGCTGDACDPQPSCTDDEKNQDESDVDCGGSCDPCALGAMCVRDTDCASGVCDLGFCGEPPSCEDEEMNADETDVDCGGPACPACPEGSYCELDSDCLEGVCTGGLCDANADVCSNGVQDEGEIDIDCGGDCGDCPLGYACDPAENACIGMMVFCDQGICGGPYVCQDEQQNGHETDVDCGGGLCPGCLGGQFCVTGEDCASGTCDTGVCTEPEWTCDDGVLNGLESDVDCGGICPACTEGYYCGSLFDCEWLPCEDGVCGGLWTCQNSTQDVHETDVDCGGPCDPCGVGASCELPADCGSGYCSEGVCGYADTCGNGDLDGSETDLDCGGAGCVTCEVGKSCVEDGDCTTGSCESGTCAHTIISLQSSADSVGCTTPGEVVVLQDVELPVAMVATPKLQLDAATDAYWVVEEAGRLGSFTATEYSGILVSVDATLGTAFDVASAVSLKGDYVEVDCQSMIRVGATGYMTALAGRFGLPEPYYANWELRNGGSEENTEALEGLLVKTNGRVADVTGFTGPEAPGQPLWWFTMGVGVLVANDFGLTNLPAVDDEVTVTGVVKYSQGKYVLVPRRASDIEVVTLPPPPPPPPPPAP